MRRALLVLALAMAAHAKQFVILGDRTGEAQPGVYGAVWREIAAIKPEFASVTSDGFPSPLVSPCGFKST